MADLKAQLAISADATGVEAGVNKAKQSLSSLGATAAAAGKKAGEGIDGIGKSGQESAKSVDRATRGMIASIQRTTATLDAGGRSSAKYFELLASQRGVDVSALKPYLDQLDAVSVKQKGAAVAAAAVAPAITQVGMSARATAAALRGVPAQFTDIVTSLQGGQAPLTVFLQQGGQLKDMFGGLGPAARALGGYVAGLINPFTVAAGAVAALGLAYFQGSKEADAYAKAIILSGNAAGTTVSDLTAMAQRIDAITGTQAAAADALAEFAGNGQIAGESIERFTTIALKMEKETGQAVKETVKQFAELGRSPVEASAKLNETTNYLTASLYKQIKALDDQGKVTEAAALAQKAYADALDARLTQVTSRLGVIERSWRSITGVAKEAWDAMLNVGRANTVQQQLEEAQTALADRQKRGALNPATSAAFDKGNDVLRQRIAFLSESVRLEGRTAENQKIAADQARAAIEFEKNGEKFLSTKVKMEKEIAKERALGAAAGASQAEIEKRVADIRDKMKDKGAISAGLQVDKARLGLDVELIKNATEELLGNYANSERIMESLRSAGLVSDRQYYESKRSFINLETQAKEEALKKEIARYQQEGLAGKDRLENDKKIADATSKLAVLRADSSSKLVVLANQEEAAAKRIELSYLSARQAAQDYFDILTRQQDRDLAGMGQGAQKRNFNAGVGQIEDRYGGQRRDLENQRAQLELEGKFTGEARTQYEQRLAIINEFQSKSIASYTGYYQRLIEQQGSWSLGASEGLQNYLDQSRNVFAQVEDLVTGAFKGMEDALVKFVTTGKLDFRSLAQSILVDIARIQAKKAIVGLIDFAVSAFGAYSGSSANPSASNYENSFDLQNVGRRALGGPVSAGGMYEVNERGPELLNIGGRQYLMMGDQGGSVTANGGGGVNVQVNVDASGSSAQGSNENSKELGRMIGSAVRSVLVQEQMPGGLLATA